MLHFFVPVKENLLKVSSKIMLQYEIIWCQKFGIINISYLYAQYLKC